jgi:integrase
MAKPETVAAVAHWWLLAHVDVSQLWHENLQTLVRRITERLGRVRVRDLDEATVGAFGRELLAEGRDRDYAQAIVRTLKRMLDAAQAHGLVASNPARGAARRLPIVRRRRVTRDRPVGRSGRAPVPPLTQDIALAAYAERWLAQGASMLRPRTLENYEWALRRYLLPELGGVVVAKLTRTQVRRVLSDALQRGQAPGTVKLIACTIRALLNAAIDDELREQNPALRIVASMRLPSLIRQREVMALAGEQVHQVLELAPSVAPRQAVYFLTLARTGMRVSEALGLQWDDIDFDRRQIHVCRQWTERGPQPLKAGGPRIVDMSGQLADGLRRLGAQREKAAAHRRCPVPPWLFCTPPGARNGRNGGGVPWARRHVARAFKAILRAAGLPLHLKPKSLRHSFASILIAEGHPLEYISRTLGHSSIAITVGVYGRWLPMRRPETVDALDRACTPAAERVATTDQSAAIVNVLRRARWAIEQPTRWCTGTMARDAAGDETEPEAPDAVAWCAGGALVHGAVAHELQAEGLHYLIGAAGERYWPDEEDWTWEMVARVNDEHGHAAVLAMYDRAIGLAAEHAPAS